MSSRQQFYGATRQRGAIGMMAALTLGMALVFVLLVVDSGRLYLEKRDLQRVADMAALEASTRGGDCAAGATATVYANASANRNGFTFPGPDRNLQVACGVGVPCLEPVHDAEEPKQDEQDQRQKPHGRGSAEGFSILAQAGRLQRAIAKD